MFIKNPFEPNPPSGGEKTRSALDWEESAYDTVSGIKDIHDDDRHKPEFVLTRLILLLIFVLLAGRLAYLQVIKGAYFRSLAENNRIRSQVVEAPRGLIFDRFNKPLLENVAGFNLVVVPFDLPKTGTEEQIAKLSETLGLDQAAVKAKVSGLDARSISPVVVAQDLPPEKAILFQTRASEFLGFSVEQAPIRNYFEPEIFSHILGYTGLADQKDIAAYNLSSDETGLQVGKQGIEVKYENDLRGQAGESQVEIDASGKILKVLGEKPSQPGNSLVLNIDMELQNELYAELSKNNGGHIKAAAVALNPKTGEVLALVSMPGFNTNLFSHGISQDDYQKFLNDPLKPFLNRALAGQYPPGSTVKPMVAAAALNEGVIDENTVIVDKGVLVIPNQFDPQVAYNFYGWKLNGLGPMNVRSAIAQSSDIFFYTVAGGYPTSKVSGLGAEKLAEYYRKFHLGSPLGVDLPGEKGGVVADPAWKAQAFADDPILKRWYLGDTYHIGIGQGDMLATPLQVAEWTSIIANNGVGMKPEILNRVVDKDNKTVRQNQPQVLVSKFLPDNILKIVQEGMRETVTQGSGRLLNSLPMTSAGKTGTSQFDGSDPKKTHAWFTAYAPYEDPQIVITVLVEAGGEGHAVAEPVAKEVLDWWAKNRLGKSK